MSLVTAQVETFPHRSIAGELIDVEGLPFEDEFFRGTVPVVIEHEAPSANGGLRCVGIGHVRSYELTPTVEAAAASERYWHDQYGNVFTTLVTKGNNFSEAALVKPASAYNAYGLQEGGALLRSLRASKIMREAGVDTEWLVRIEEPTQLNFDGELVAPAEYRRRLVMKLIGETALGLEGARRFGLAVDEPPTEQEIGDIAKTIGKMEFFVTLRAMATPYRVRDLIGTGLLHYQTLEEVFTTYNLVAPLRRADFELLGLPSALTLPSLEKLSEDSADVGRYFTEILPKLIGLNLARMHAIKTEDNPEPAGLAHHFLTTGNVTALGGIVDLDSVKGKALDLDDEPQTYAAVSRDLVFILDSELLKEFAGSHGHLLSSSPDQFRASFTDNLFETYMRIIFGQTETSIVSKVDFLAELNDHVGEEWIQKQLDGLCFPYVGELIETETAKFVQEPLTIEPEFMAARVYRHFIHGREQWLYQEGFLPPAEARRPTAEEIDNAMRKSFAGDMVVGKDIFKDALAGELYETRSQQVFEHSAELYAKIRAQIKGTPLEGISDETVASLLVFHPLEAVEASVENVILPDADKVWALLRKAFEDIYLDKKLDSDLEIEAYLAVLAHDKEFIAEATNALISMVSGANS